MGLAREKNENKDLLNQVAESENITLRHVKEIFLEHLGPSVS